MKIFSYHDFSMKRVSGKKEIFYFIRFLVKGLNSVGKNEIFLLGAHVEFFFAMSQNDHCGECFIWKMEDIV